MITDGPFRRNPGYLGAALVYAGIASLKNALWTVLLLPVTLLTMQRTAIRREERYLWRRPRHGAVPLACVPLVFVDQRFSHGVSSQRPRIFALRRLVF